MNICFLTLTGGSYHINIPIGTKVCEVRELLKQKNLISGDNFSLYSNGQNLNDNLILNDHTLQEKQIVITEKQINKKNEINEKEILQEEEEELFELEIESEESEKSNEEDLMDDNFDDIVVDYIKKPIKKKRRPKKKVIDPENFDDLVSELVNLGFDISNCKKILRSSHYNVNSAATKLFEDMNIGKEMEESDYSPEETENNKYKFSRKKRDFLGEFRDLYNNLTKEEKISIKNLEKETMQEKATVVQTFVACNNDYKTALECLLESI